MKLAILGATGKTGQPLVQQALAAGHEVVAVMRDTSNYTVQHEKLQAKEGNIYSEDSLSEIFQGCDAVMSCLGAKQRKTTIYSESMKVITKAMAKAGVTRLIAMSSWCNKDIPDDRGPFMWEWVFRPTFMKHIFADMASMEAYLRESCPDVNYTIVRPPVLTNKPVTDKPFKVEIERLHVPGGSGKIARADVARFMLDCTQKTDYDRKMLAIDV